MNESQWPLNSEAVVQIVTRNFSDRHIAVVALAAINCWKEQFGGISLFAYTGLYRLRLTPLTESLHNSLLTAEGREFKID